MRGQLSAVIVAYRSRGELPRCFEALAKVTGLERIIVVDHGDDDSGEVAGALGAVVLEDPSNPGYGTGQNRGVAQTSTEYVLLVNPDAAVDPAGIAAGLACIDGAEDVAAVQGIIRNRVTEKPERSSGVALNPTHLFGRALGARRLLRFRPVRAAVGGVSGLADHVQRVPVAPTDVESLAATALLLRRSAFDEVGGFDEGYFLYGEDLDLCRRLRAAGWRLLALPLPWAEHTSGASSAGWWRRELVWWEGTLRYAARWWTPAAWRAAQAATLIRVIPLVLVRPAQATEIVTRLLVNPARARHTRPHPAES